jgi:hypothetical protein
VASILALEEKFPLGECSTHDGGATPQQRREQEQAEQVEQDPNITRREITIDLALSVLGSVWTALRHTTRPEPPRAASLSDRAGNNDAETFACQLTRALL